MVNKEKTQLVPHKPLKDDAAPVDITNIKLSSPPNYKLGEKVIVFTSFNIYLFIIKREFLL